MDGPFVETSRGKKRHTSNENLCESYFCCQSQHQYALQIPTKAAEREYDERKYFIDYTHKLHVLIELLTAEVSGLIYKFHMLYDRILKFEKNLHTTRQTVNELMLNYRESLLWLHRHTSAFFVDRIPSTGEGHYYYGE